MAERSKCSILVVAKAPIVGEEKTRLIPRLSPEQACELYRRMLRHTLNAASRADLGAIALWCAAEIEHPYFISLQQEFDLELKIQAYGDLGVKMQSALQDALHRSECAILIGGDCPSIDATYLRDAAASLTESAPLVLGPALDGGYGLIGAREVAPDIFNDVPWGSATVMETTRRILMGKALGWRELAPIWDVDRPEDLARLLADDQWNHLTANLPQENLAA